MSKQEINIGLQGNDGTGESIREAFRKVNENFNEIYGVLGLTDGIIGLTNLGDWTPTEVYKPDGLIVSDSDGEKLLSKTIEGEGGIDVTVESTRIVIASQTAKMFRDPAPKLGGPLNATQGIAKLPNIDASTNFGQTTVTAFNNTHTGESITTTVRELAVNKAYVDDNFIRTVAGKAIDPLSVRDEPLVEDINNPDYDPDLPGNWLASETLPRKSVVRRQGDTMEGLLTLFDHPDGLAGLGTPQGADDLQAATKFYVDKSSWSSQVNLFVSTSSGDDTQALTPAGKEGRHWNYSYKSVGAAALAAENLINLSNFEPGPYKQSIIYTIAPDTFFSTVHSVNFLDGNVGNVGYEDAYTLLKENKSFIQAEIISYINTKYVNKLVYDVEEFQSDISEILDAVGYDLVLGTNYNSVSFVRLYNVPSDRLVQTIDGINYAKILIENYSYSETTRRQDIELFLDAIGNDLIFTSNFQSVRAGLSYYHKSFDNANASELEQIIGALGFIKEELLLLPEVVASGTIAQYISDDIDIIINIIQNGTSGVPNFDLPASVNTPDGATSARDLLLGNVKFIQAEVIGYLSANYPILSYNKEIKKRDVQYMIWAVVYDLMYDGNTASYYAGDQFGVGGILEIASIEVVATVDAIRYIRTIAKKIVQNLTPDTVYQSTYRQYKNSGLLDGENVNDSIDTLFTLIGEIISNGIESATELPFDDVGLDPDLLDAQAAIQSSTETIKDDTIDYINTEFDVINDTNAINNIVSSFGTITTVLDGGLELLPTTTFTSPVSLAIGKAQAATLIEDNYDFIRDEVIGYLDSPTFTGFDYNGNPVNGPIAFSIDLQYLIEAVIYDLTYGGNSASTYAAQQYFAGQNFQSLQSEVSIISDAFTYAQTLCRNVATNTTPDDIYSSTPQVKNPAFTQGSAAYLDINTAWNRIKLVIESNPTNPAVTYPDLTGYNASYKNARTILQNNRTSIAQSVTAYLDDTYAGGFSYDEGICFRDLGYLIDAAAIDIITGGTYQSINAGKSYYRNTSARNIAIGTQYTETLDAIEYAKIVTLACLNQTPITKYQSVIEQYFNVSYIASTPAKNYISANWDIVTNIIKFGFGAAPTPSFGTGTVEIQFTNGGNGNVDQGISSNIDIIPGKILIGETSAGNATIVSYTEGGGSEYDTVIVRLLQPIDFQEGERLSYAETVRDLQITIFVESGIYYEDYPIRLSQNVSIKGNDFRRTIIRPRDRVSQSPWRKIFFHRDAVLDGMQLGDIDTSLDYATATTATLSGVNGKIQVTLGSGTAPRDWIGRVFQVGVGKAQIDSVANNLLNCSTIYPFDTSGLKAIGTWHIYKPQNYGRHYLENPNDINSPAKNNKDIDVFLCNDATRVNNLSMQGHGGFAMVLDPEGQIKSKSPYGQVCSSFSGSLNTKRFAGGQFVDGFAGRLKGTIIEVDGFQTETGTTAEGYTEITVKGGVNSGLDVRAPNAPCAFFWQGFRYQINNILSYDNATATVVLGLSNTTPWPYTVSFAYDQDKCARDVGLILDAVTYDLVIGSNYQSYKAGLSYLRSYSVNVINSQSEETIAGINYARDEAVALAGAYGSTVTTNMGIITDLIDTGISFFDPADLVYPNPAGASAGLTNAKELLIDNRTFMCAEVVAYLEFKYNTESIAGYDAELSARDTGYVIDAIIYDLLYGGNSQTVDAARAYYDAAGNTLIPGEQTICADGMSRLKAIMKDIALSNEVTVTDGNIEEQVFGVAGSGVAGTIDTLVDIVIDIMKNGLSVAPTITNPSLTVYDSGLKDARSDILANRSTIQLGTLEFLTDTYGDVYNINIEMGGNKSMLANDFAMVNDLGYGIVAGNGALTEQVSTFTYYCHTHYWSFNGGQIRSVAGSNAHGTYGLRASGYDVTELPDAVTLSYNLVQSAKVYKINETASQMGVEDRVVYISNYDYVPQNISQLEIDFSRAGKSNTRYEVTSIGRTPYYVEYNTILAATRNPVKTGTGPYFVEYTLATQSAPTIGVYYTVIGNSNKNYNGNYLCTASSTTSITLRYTEDPGTAGTTGFVTTGASSASGVTTVTFAAQATPPFAVGSKIYVKGLTPTGYNGVFTVTECTVSFVRYAASVVGPMSISGIVSSTSINAQNVLQLNLGSSGNNNTSATGLAAPLYHQQNVLIQILQYFKFDDINNVNPTRPSTALQFDDNLADIYRIIAYNLVESTGEALVIENGQGQAVLSSDQSFNYYKIFSDPARISTTDPVDGGTKTMGARIGDTRIAISPLDSATTIAQINKGTYVTAIGGRTHRILGYTPTTGSVFSVTGLSGDGTTATVSFEIQLSNPFPIGSTVSVAGVTPSAYNGTYIVTDSDVNFVSFLSTAIGSQTPNTSGTVFGGGIPAYLSIESKPVKSSSQSYEGGITVSNMKLKSGNGPYYITYAIPLQDWPVEIDQYFNITGNVITTTATSVSSSNIVVNDATSMAVGNTITFSGSSFGGISTSTTYYVSKIVSTTSIQVSLTRGGLAEVFTTGVGALTVTAQAAVNGNRQVVAGPVLSTTGASGDGTNATVNFNDVRATSTMTGTAATGNIITLASAASLGVGEKIVFTAVTQTTTATVTKNASATLDLSSIDGTGVLTVGTVGSGTIEIGMMLSGGTIVANTVWITGNISGSGAGSTWQTNTTIAVASATITGTTDLITLASSSGMVAGSTIVFTAGTGAVFGNIVSGTTYYVKQVLSGGTLISISSTYNGANFTLTSATPGTTMTAVAGAEFGSITSGTTYYIATIIDNQITISTSSSLTPIVTLTNGNGTWISRAGEEPFPVGSVITVADIVPAGYNGNFTVISRTTSSVTYANTQTGTPSVNGTVSQASIAGIKNQITFRYPTDPGVFSNGITTLTLPKTGIDTPLATDASYTIRAGYPSGATAQITVKISTCRATGHDFLDIGTGGYNTTNYPYQIYGNPAQSQTGQAGEVYEEGVGRCFYVTTDQNGIFRVGRFFTVDQGTGTVTFSASIALSNLDGIGFKRGVVVSEFSTDTTMTNNASEIVPVQSAVRGYIDRRLGIDHGGTVVSATNLIGKGYLSLSGDLQMKGNLNMGDNSVTQVKNPVNNQDAATKIYVDTEVARFDRLDELNDTDILLPASGDNLVYDAVTSSWKNVPLVAGTSILPTTNISGNGTTVTVTFPTQVTAPFSVGQTIIITGVVPVGYNGAWTVSTCTISQLTFSSTATGAYSVAGTIIGNQVRFHYSTATGRLSTAINNSVIVDAAISNTAAINQTKIGFDLAYASIEQITGVVANGSGSVITFTYPILSAAPFTVGQRIVVSGISVSGYNNTWTVTNCTTTTITVNGTTTGSGTGGTIRPIKSTASFDTTNFVVTNGWVSIKAGSIQLSQLATITSGRVLANFSGSTTNPISETAQSVYENGLFQKHGSSTGAVTYGGSLGTVSITAISAVSGVADALVKTDGSAYIDVTGVKIGTNTFITYSGSTIELTTPNGFKFFTANGTSSSNTIVNVSGDLRVNSTNSKLTVVDLTSGAATTEGLLTGLWKLTANSILDLATNNNDLKVKKITTGASGTAGELTGAWSIASGSTFSTTNTNLSVKNVTVAALGTVDFSTNNATLLTRSLTTGGTATIGYITGDWQLNAGSKMQATYADLAEFYSADKDYDVGTVLVFGGDAEVTTTTTFGDTRVAGVVSENPAYTMNASLEGTRACLALQGRVPVKVLGTVKKGDLLTTAARAGYACKAINPQVGTIIGKALADKTDADVGIVEVAVGRL